MKQSRPLKKRIICVASSSPIKNRHIVINNAVHIARDKQDRSDKKLFDIIGQRVIV